LTQWYLNRDGQPQGPLTAEALAAQFRAGQIQTHQLVWRQGLPQWQPISSCLAELGVVPAFPPPPPPLPSRPTSAAGTVAPRRGLSGCAIVALVVAAGVVPVVAILAAIAIPAYQDYVARAAVSQAIGAARTAKLELQMAMIGQPSAQCPRNGQGALKAPEDYAGHGLASITFARFESGDCGLQLVLRQPEHRQLDGKRIWLELQPGLTGGWHCHAELRDKLLPASCRSQSP
jgi:type IV pilus assembly protein PilA